MPRHKTKLISIQTPKPSHFRPPNKNQVNSDLCTETKLSSIPHIAIKSISTTHTKTKSSLTLTLKPSDFQTTYKNQVNRYPHFKRCFRPAQKKQVNRDPRAKTKSISIHNWKPNDYRPEHNKINFNPAHKKVNFDTYTKTTSISIPPHKNQVNFDPITEIRSISIPTLTSSRFDTPTHKPS